MPIFSRSPRSSLATWLHIGAVLVVIMTAAPLVLVLGHLAKRDALEQASDSMQQVAWQLRDQLDRGMWDRFEDVQRLAREDMVTRRGDAAAIRRSLERLQTSFPELAWIGMTDASGKVTAAARGLLEGADVSQRPWFADSVKGRFVGDVHPAVLLAKKLPAQDEPWRFVDIAFPVRNADGSLHGVLGAHLSWRWARELQNSLIEPTLKDFLADIWIVQPDGTVLLGPKGHKEERLALKAVTMAATQDGGALVERWPDGKSYVTAYSRTKGYREYPGLGWIVLARQPETVALAHFNDVQSKLIVLAVAVCALMLMVSSVFARRLSRPLDTLTRAVQDHTAGDRNIDIPAAHEFREAAVLSQALARFVDSERRHSAQLARINASLEARVEERTQDLHEANEHLARALGEQAQAEKMARDSESVMRAVLQNTNDAYISINAEGLITEWNANAHAIFGWSREEAMGQAMSALIIPPALREGHDRGIARYLAGAPAKVLDRRIELQALHREGHCFPIELTISVVRRGEEVIISAFLHDISERKAMQASLARQAYEDALTTLPNRRSLLERVPQAVARARRSAKPLALLFLDLDGFKTVNDRHGHEVGDALLCAFAKRLQSSVRESDTVARLAGDEFTILLESLTGGADDAAAIAQKILDAMRAPFDFDGLQLTISTSIGIAVHEPNATISAEELLSQADGAMYSAKRAGKNQLAFHVDERVALEAAG